MSPETVDTVVTVALTVGLVLSGVAAIAALPWRRAEVDAAHRAAVALGMGALRVVVVPEPAPPAHLAPVSTVLRRVRA